MQPEVGVSLHNYAPLEHRSVLELGCGYMTQAPKVLRHGGSYTGLDANLATIEQNRTLLPRASFVHGRAEVASSLLDGHHFDLFVSIYGALQFGNASRVLGEARRLAAPHASLIISARHPSLHADDADLDRGRPPELRLYTVSTRPKQLLRMNVSDKTGWMELFESYGWRIVRYAELPTSETPDTSIYILEAG